MAEGLRVTDDLRDLLYRYDRAAPLHATVEERRERDGLVQERHSFIGAFGARVPGMLVYDRAVPAPRPVLLIQHGLNSGKDDPRLTLLHGASARARFACVTIWTERGRRTSVSA